jgi:hypothetical protein
VNALERIPPVRLAPPAAPTRRVWLDAALVCVACGRKVYGVRPGPWCWSWLTCQARMREANGRHRECVARWWAFTLPPAATGLELARAIGTRATLALCEHLDTSIDALIAPAHREAYLQVEVTRDEALTHALTPAGALLAALGLVRV